MQHKQKVSFIVSVIFILFVVAIYYFSIKYALPFLSPFLVAFIIGGMLQRPIRFFAKKTKINQKFWAVVVTLVFFLTIGVGVFYIIYYIVHSVESIVLSIPDYVTQISDELSSATEGKFSNLIAFLPDQLEQKVVVFMQELSDDFSATIQGMIIKYSSDIASLFTTGGVGEAAINIPVKFASVVVGIVIAIIGSFFISTDYVNIKKMILNLFPAKYRPTARRVKNFTIDTVFKMVKTYATLVLITYTELVIGFLIFKIAGFNVPYIPVVAAAIAVIDILPVLGVGTVLLPWAVINIILGNWMYAIMILILYAIIWVARNFTEPKLVGSSFGLPPILMLMAIYAGGKLLGFMGLFIVPLTIVILKRLNDAGIIKLIDEIKSIRRLSAKEKTGDTVQ